MLFANNSFQINKCHLLCGFLWFYLSIIVCIIGEIGELGAYKFSVIDKCKFTFGYP